MRKIGSILLSVTLIASLLSGCAQGKQVSKEQTPQKESAQVEKNDSKITALTNPTKTPKYVFLFIGDGMSYPQIQISSDYLGALQDKDYFQAEPSIEDNQGAKLDGAKYLNFMNFQANGSAVTYDSNSFAPDSASTATAIATGHKTYSGTINMNEDFTVSYESIAEKVHKQLGMKVGVISSVNLNHATPAAFYAHQPSRDNYYQIGLELIHSNFEYFAGGGLKKVTGEDGNQKDLYQLASEAGYDVIKDQATAEKVNKDNKKVMIIDQNLADSDSMQYEVDRQDNQWALADYVSKGIDVLDNEKGFFMMCEGGKIDWACHANDAASTIHDTVALSNAVQVAMDFEKKHPDETLILTTADHETGGLTIGFAGTNYDTFLTMLKNQKISYAKFDTDYVAAYKQNKTDFDTVLADIEKLFGLKKSGNADDKLVLTDYELSELKQAYDLSINDNSNQMDKQEEYVLYGKYEPLTVTITHILNNKSGVNFSSYSHTGLPVPVFADGVDAKMFDGYYDNTQLYKKMANILNVK